MRGQPQQKTWFLQFCDLEKIREAERAVLIVHDLGFFADSAEP